MYHRKAERVLYHDGILYFRSFGQSETRKLSSVQPLFCPETEISSEAWVALLPPAARRRSRSAGRAHARDHTPRAPRRAAGPRARGEGSDDCRSRAAASGVTCTRSAYSAR
jgi:hypothetical protein